MQPIIWKIALVYVWYLQIEQATGINTYEVIEGNSYIITQEQPKQNRNQNMVQMLTKAVEEIATRWTTQLLKGTISKRTEQKYYVVK